MAEKLACTREEKHLILLAQRGDESAMQQIIECYLPLIRATAMRSALFFSDQLMEDLIQAGTIGLLKAIKRFSFDAGAKLSTYALPWILGEIRQAIRLSSEVTGIESGKKKIERMQEELLLRLQRMPTLKELAQACCMTAEQVSELSALSLVKPDAENNDREQQGKEFLGCHAKEFESVELNMTIQSLSTVERSAIILRYFRDFTQKETAALLGCSQAQISRIERRALDALKELLS